LNVLFIDTQFYIMKNITKVVLAASFAVATFFTANPVKAQSRTGVNDWSFGLGVEAGAPTGEYYGAKRTDFMLGVTARLQHGLSKNIAFMATTGYYNMFGKDLGNAQSDFGIVPLKAGLKFYTDGGFYVSAEAGAGFETAIFKDTKLILSPGVGYSWTNVDLGVRYENFSGQNNNYGMVAARLAYAFKL
jgi:hypothetical protein